MVIPETIEFSHLTHCVEFDDRFYSIGDLVVCMSESDAEKLSEISGVEIEWQKEKRKPGNPLPTASEIHGRKTIFVPFKKQIVLNEWEKVFDESVGEKIGPA